MEPISFQDLESLGATLKRQRELRNISLEEIASATKIRQEYLEAIEQDRFERVPGLTFLKGYVRAYAQHLGLASDEIVFRLQLLIEARDSAPGSSAFPLRVFIFLILGLLLVGVGLYFLIQRYRI